MARATILPAVRIRLADGTTTSADTAAPQRMQRRTRTVDQLQLAEFE